MKLKRNWNKTFSELIWNCFVSVSFQFHYNCGNSFSAPQSARRPGNDGANHRPFQVDLVNLSASVCRKSVSRRSNGKKRRPATWHDQSRARSPHKRLQVRRQTDRQTAKNDVFYGTKMRDFCSTGDCRDIETRRNFRPSLDRDIFVTVLLWSQNQI